MFKTIKEFFLGKPVETPAAPKVEETKPVHANDVPLQPAVEQVQPVVEAKVDPVAVALDLEPVDFAASPAAPAKKPRKPRAPKAVVATPAKATKPKVTKPKAEKAPKEKKPAVIKAKKVK
jgi:hypothetical protein